jgi:hypothetical protein
MTTTATRDVRPAPDAGDIAAADEPAPVWHARPGQRIQRARPCRTAGAGCPRLAGATSLPASVGSGLGDQISAKVVHLSRRTHKAARGDRGVPFHTSDDGLR